MKRNLLILISFILIFTACATSQQTSDQKPKEKEIYVFDDANVKNTKDSVKAADQKAAEQKPVQNPAINQNNEIPMLKGMNYIVQLGAFSSKDKAEKFVSDNKNMLNYEMKISYSDAVKLFVVQLPPYTTKEEAEKVRNKLWESPVFKDAFIVTLEKK